MRKLLFGMVLVCLFNTVSLADLYLQGIGTDHALSYSHDRFYSGMDKTFIGQGYDWSGVGQTPAGRWATMISPSYFISANHYHPNPGDTLTFYSGNSTSSPSYQFGIASGMLVPGSLDIYLGKLSTPIPAADDIATYPIWTLPSLSAYRGADVFIYGVPNRVGRNVISYDDSSMVTYDFSVTGGDGPDEAYIMSRDSGGPSFGYYNGQLAVVGTHLFNSGSPPYEGATCTDTNVSSCVSALQANMVGETLTSTQLYKSGDVNLDGSVDFHDFQIVLNHWLNSGAGVGWAQGDFNGDGTVDFQDMQKMLDNWSPQGAVSFTTPEPSCVCLLLLGGLALIGLTQRGIQRRLDDFRACFNEHRPHRALHGQKHRENPEGRVLPEPLPILARDPLQPQIEIHLKHCHGAPRFPIIDISVRLAA